MPTYEYRCKSCGEHLEVVQSFTDDALTDCPRCGASGELRKVFGNIGITFKGSGFYKTDSRSGSKTTAAKADDGGSSSSESTTKADTKAEKSEKSDSKAEKSDTKRDTKRDKPTTTSSTSAA